MLIRRPATSTSRSGVVPLVWHQARRRASDPAHTTERILDGLQMGARVGIDICPMSDGHFAVLHGPRLDRETTGFGPVIRSRAADLAGLQRRNQDGGTIQEAPFTLAALAEAVGTGARGFLHITLRCGDEALRPGHQVGFARAPAPLGSRAHLGLARPLPPPRHPAHERRADIHEAVVTLGCALICLNQIRRFC